MSTQSLILTAFLVIIPLWISYKEKLTLEKDIIVSMLRAVIQLLIVGYLLEFIFGLESPIYTILLVLVMIVNAAVNTKNKGIKMPYKGIIAFIALLIGTSMTLIILVISGAIGFTANEVIPVAGMIISNSMIAIGLSYRHLSVSFQEKRMEVEVKLSLGAEVKEAAHNIIRESIKVAIMPSIDSAKTLGIVALPGMMTGLILGGASPIVAVKFQIMVTFMILASASIATILAVYWSYKFFFNERKQLKKINE